MKKIIVLLLVGLFGLTIASCGKEKLTQVYIIEYVSATALDDAKDGIIEGLKAKGFEDGKNIEITVMNPQTKADTLAQMAETAVEKADIIFAIATPVAQVLVNEVNKQGSDVPIVFTAVTDPVASGIIADANNPGINVTGTTDLNPVADQVALLTQINPNAKKLGFIYTTGETNSEIQLNLAQAACSKMGVTVEASSCTNSTDLQQVLNALIGSNIDALYIPTDNDVASQMQIVAQTCNDAGIITICGESNQLKDGGIITIGSVNYLELGKMTGQMGAEILKGADASKMAVKGWTSTELVINKALVETYKLAIPKTLLDAAQDIK